MEPFYEALASARDLTLDEQRKLLRMLATNIKHLERAEGVHGTGFNVGDQVIVELRPRTEVQLTITSFSSDGTCVQGVAEDGTTFIVSVTQCREA